MNTRYPILARSDYTPPFADLGLQVSCSPTHGGDGTSAVWVHGALLLDAEETSRAAQDRWLKALNVVATGEANEIPRAARVVPDAQLPSFDAHFGAAELLFGSSVLALPFSFDLCDAIGDDLGDDNLWVKVSCWEHCSTPARVVRSEVGANHLGESAGEGSEERFAADQLIEAYDAASAGRWTDAIELFALALADEHLRAERDRPHLLNAAAAARRAARDAGTQAADLLRQALEWQRTDLELRTERLIQIEQELPRASDDERRSLEACRSRLLSDAGLS